MNECKRCGELEKEVTEWKRGYCHWHNLFHRQYIHSSRLAIDKMKEHEEKYPELLLPKSEARIEMEEGLIKLEKGWGMEVVYE